MLVRGRRCEIDALLHRLGAALPQEWFRVSAKGCQQVQLPDGSVVENRGKGWWRMNEAYRQLVESGDLTERQLDVYGVLLRLRHKYLTGMTAREIAEYLRSSDFGGRPHSGVHGRLRELEDLGLARQIGSRRCPHSHRVCMAWTCWT
jgi:hypothetical protein